MSNTATQEFQQLVEIVVEYHEKIFAVSQSQADDDANQARVDWLFEQWQQRGERITTREKALIDEISARLTWTRFPQHAGQPISEALQVVLSQDWAKTLREALAACQEAGKGIPEAKAVDAPPSVPIPQGTTDGWEMVFTGQTPLEIVNEATDAIVNTSDDLLGLALLDYKATERDLAAARIAELEVRVVELEALLSHPRGTIPTQTTGAGK
jgi:hypothetical protein